MSAVDRLRARSERNVRANCATTTKASPISQRRVLYMQFHQSLFGNERAILTDGHTTGNQLRRIALDAQGLTRAAPFGRGVDATHRALEQLGYVQIDTISIVARAHHHTLWNRVPNYQPAHLDRLVRDRRAFEYWFHAAAYLPMRDFRFALPRMHALKSGERHWFKRRTAN